MPRFGSVEVIVFATQKAPHTGLLFCLSKAIPETMVRFGIGGAGCSILHAIEFCDFFRMRKTRTDSTQTDNGELISDVSPKSVTVKGS